MRRSRINRACRRKLLSPLIYRRLWFLFIHELRCWTYLLVHWQAVKAREREAVDIFVHCYSMNHALVYAIAHHFYLISKLHYQSSFYVRHADPVVVFVFYLKPLAALE
ncbi:hypothetical protein IGI04_014214 [Brassica rapa subsp. trilocularis]|uniref:Uncharacterized protein n=1 Tax=Brassica rapa subsp. trilocularis TaxID=1813537 RepID=A0ABQ7MLL7_BRACM|nr:hypothetical protein IGI04_014214 [Brassica rapa subsp. trilocularis]